MAGIPTLNFLCENEDCRFDRIKIADFLILQRYCEGISKGGALR